MINKPIQEMTLKELKMESKIMADILNKRLRRLEEQNLASSSMFYEYTTNYARQHKQFIDYTKQGKVKYSTGFGKYNRGEMISIYKAMRKATSASTSTVTGTKKALKKKELAIRAYLKDNGFDEHIFLEVSDINELFKTARETGFLNTYGSDTVMKMANSGKSLQTLQDRIKKINDVSNRLSKKQLPNASVVKSMSMSDRDFDKWLDNEETKSFTRAVRATNKRLLQTDEEREFETISRNTARKARTVTKQENEIANISKALNNNLRGKKKKK